MWLGWPSWLSEDKRASDCKSTPLRSQFCRRRLARPVCCCAPRRRRAPSAAHGKSEVQAMLPSRPRAMGEGEGRRRGGEGRTGRGLTWGGQGAGRAPPSRREGTSGASARPPVRVRGRPRAGGFRVESRYRSHASETGLFLLKSPPPFLDEPGRHLIRRAGRHRSSRPAGEVRATDAPEASLCSPRLLTLSVWRALAAVSLPTSGRWWRGGMIRVYSREASERRDG